MPIRMQEITKGEPASWCQATINRGCGCFSLKGINAARTKQVACNNGDHIIMHVLCLPSPCRLPAALTAAAAAVPPHVGWNWVSPVGSQRCQTQIGKDVTLQVGRCLF